LPYRAEPAAAALMTGIAERLAPIEQETLEADD
jgi:hypothetical protein